MFGVELEAIAAAADALANRWEVTQETAWGLLENSVRAALDVDIQPPEIIEKLIDQGMLPEQARAEYYRYLAEQITSLVDTVGAEDPHGKIDLLLEEIHKAVDSGTLADTPELKSLVADLRELESELKDLRWVIEHPEEYLERTFSDGALALCGLSRDGLPAEGASAAVLNCISQQRPELLQDYYDRIRALQESIPEEYFGEPDVA